MRTASRLSWPECQLVSAGPLLLYLAAASGPGVLLSLKETAPVPQPPLAALIYLPDMCFLVCFLSPARHGPMILSRVDGAPPFMPDESITPACSAAPFSADSLFQFNQCFRKEVSAFPSIH
ncbi:hypothetical protein PBY51_013677 [Eleginops maclovinus]|uniref:Uncharacterized protein n=1 Tax=Eleginops maclovinus TaxID=56733 RepID=A0AAN7XZK5_ELEMC|nr:hypothetical protein PBY51_013677 [Eleginops maclovinus]